MWKKGASGPSAQADQAGTPKRGPAKKHNTAIEEYLELADYLVGSTAKAIYTYHKVGNLTAKVTGGNEVLNEYNAAGKMTRVTRSDETYVSFAYDAFGRKVRRTESAWVAQGNPNGTPPGLTDAKGWGNNSDRPAPGTQGKGDEKGNGKDKADPCAEEDTTTAKAPQSKGQEKSQAHKKLKLAESTTSYLYDGLGPNVLKEYKGLSASKAEYYYANGQVLGRKMFGLKGEITPDREPGMANGGLYYYLTDALGSVTDLVNHQGEVVQQYRYDAFGGLLTGTVGVYNTVGLTGKSYDAKAGLMDYSARWYDPHVGRFTQADTYKGTLGDPVSQHLYAYVGSNPVSRIDPTGHFYEDDYGSCWTGTPWDPGEETSCSGSGGGGSGTTPPPGGGTGTTPPPGDGTGTTPPPGDGTGTTPPPGDGTGTTPPPGDGSGSNPPPGDGSGTNPPPGGDDGGGGGSPPPVLTNEEKEQQNIAHTAQYGTAPESTYTVQPGDWLSSIAEKTLGDASRWPEIKALNPQIVDPDVIYPGQVLKLPGVLPAPQAATSEQTPVVVPPGPKSPELDDRECQGTWQCAPQADNLSGQSAAPAQSPVLKSTASVLSQVTTAPPQKSGASKSPNEVLDTHIAQVQQTEAAEARAAALAKEQHKASETAFNVADAASLKVGSSQSIAAPTVKYSIESGGIRYDYMSDGTVVSSKIQSQIEVKVSPKPQVENAGYVYAVTGINPVPQTPVDFVSITVGFGPVSGSLTIDKDGKVYGSLSIGASMLPVSGSFVAGMVISDDPKLKADLEGFLTGNATTICGTAVFGTACVIESMSGVDAVAMGAEISMLPFDASVSTGNTFVLFDPAKGFLPGLHAK